MTDGFEDFDWTFGAGGHLYGDQTLENIVIQWDLRYIDYSIPLPPIPAAFSGPYEWAQCYLPYIIEEQRAHIERDYFRGAPGAAWLQLLGPVTDVADWDNANRSWTCNIMFDLKQTPPPIKRKDVVILTNDCSGYGPGGGSIWALGVVRAMPNPGESYSGWQNGGGRRAPYDIAVFAPHGSELAEALRTTAVTGANSGWWIAYVGNIAPFNRMYDALQAWLLEPGLQPAPLMAAMLGFQQPADGAAAADQSSGADVAPAATPLPSCSRVAVGDQSPVTWAAGPPQPMLAESPAVEGVAGTPPTRDDARRLAQGALLLEPRIKAAVQSYCRDVLRLPGAAETLTHAAVCQARLGRVADRLVLPPQGPASAGGSSAGSGSGSASGSGSGGAGAGIEVAATAGGTSPPVAYWGSSSSAAGAGGGGGGDGGGGGGGGGWMGPCGAAFGLVCGACAVSHPAPLSVTAAAPPPPPPAAAAAMQQPRSGADAAADAAAIVLLKAPLPPPKHHRIDGGRGGGDKVVKVAREADPRAAALAGLLSVLAAFSPPGRTLLACAHSNGRVANLAAGFLPLLRQPEQQLAGSDALPRAGLQCASPHLGTGDCVLILASHMAVQESGTSQLHLNTRVNRLFDALDGATGWYGTLSQLHQLLRATEEDLQVWSTRAAAATAADGISTGSSQASRRSSGCSGSPVVNAGRGGTEGGDGGAVVGGYVHRQLKVLIKKLLEHGQVLLDDLPSVAWDNPNHGRQDAAEPHNTGAGAEGADAGVSTCTGTGTSTGTGAPTRLGCSSSGRGSDAGSSSGRGVTLVKEMLDAAAAVQYQLGFMSAEEVQGALLGGLRSAQGGGSAARSVESCSSSSSAAELPLHPLVGAMCRLLAALEPCLGLPRCRLQSSNQDVSRSFRVTAVATIWGPEGWMTVVPELRQLVQSPPPPPPYPVSGQPPPFHADAVTRSPPGVLGAAPVTGGPGGGSSNGGRLRGVDGRVRGRLLRLLARLSELAAALAISAPEVAYLGLLGPGVNVESLTAAHQGQALLVELQAGCDGAADSLRDLTEEGARVALQMLWRQQQRQGGEQATVGQGKPRRRPLILDLAAQADPRRAAEQGSAPPVPPVAAEAVTADSVGAAALSGGSPEEASANELGTVLECLARLEQVLDVRGVVSVDALQKYCLDHARVLFATVSSLGMRDVQRADLTVDTCLMDEAGRVKAVELAPLMQPLAGGGGGSDGGRDGGGGSGGGGGGGGGGIGGDGAGPTVRIGEGFGSPRLMLLVGPPQGGDGRPYVCSRWCKEQGYGMGVYDELVLRGEREWELLDPPTATQTRASTAAAPATPQTAAAAAATKASAPMATSPATLPTASAAVCGPVIAAAASPAAAAAWAAIPAAAPSSSWMRQDVRKPAAWPSPARDADLRAAMPPGGCMVMAAAAPATPSPQPPTRGAAPPAGLTTWAAVAARNTASNHSGARRKKA